MIAGMMSPACSFVRALNSWQNCMMLTPCCPSAGPTGGAGLAAPAGHWSFTIAVTRFFDPPFAGAAFAAGAAILSILSLRSLQSLDLEEIELDRRGASEDADHHLELASLLVDLLDDARELAERAAHHADVLAHSVGDVGDRLRFRSLDPAEDA